MRVFQQETEPVLQPSPARNPSGDCIACVLTAALRFLIPENPPSFDECFDRFKAESVGGSDVLDNTWGGMKKALEETGGLEVDTDIAPPRFDHARFGYAWFKGNYRFYFRYLEGYLRSGWIVVSEMNYAGSGPFTPEGYHNHQNHFVLLTGVREYWKDHERVGGCWYLAQEVEVTCSSKGKYWIKLDDLLNKHGAAGWIIARRRAKI